jgi:hypothetical protein
VAPEETTSVTERLIEIVAVLLLGIATVGTAWCGYQSSQWNGAQSDLARAASDERVEASRLFGLATQRISYDASVVAQYAQAVQTGNDNLAQFYKRTLVRPPFVPLLDQWQAQVSAGSTPTSLFEDPAYLGAQFADYQAAVERAEAATAASQQASETANQYVITTILLAVALFFAGVTSSFRYKPARVLLVILAIGTVAVAATRLADLPIT